MVAQSLSAQTDPLDWVRHHSIAVRSHSFADGDFSDLEPLAQILAGVRIVQLAELSHGDGNGSAVRARLIRFLHRRLGFRVVVWEAGFYECHIMNELRARGASMDAIGASCLWPFWRESAEIAPLFAYAQTTWDTDSPLLMAGFDLQFTGEFLERRLRDFGDLFDHAGRPLPPELGRIVRGRATNATRDTLIARAQDFVAHFEQNAGVMRQAHGVREANRIERVLRNMAEYQVVVTDRDRSRSGGPDALDVFVRSYNRRERVNAANLVWLANEYYSGEKLIVWSHNVHAANTRIPPDYRALAASDTSASLESSGRLLKLTLGDDVYSIGTLAYSGEWGFPARLPERIPEAEPGAFEHMLNGMGVPIILVNLRPAREPNHWLLQPMPGSISAQVPGARYPVVWAAIFDGVLFLQRMSPATLLRRRHRRARYLVRRAHPDDGTATRGELMTSRRSRMRSSLPDKVMRDLPGAHGRRAADWIRALPHYIDELMEEWSLVSLGKPFTGARAGLVAPVRDRRGTYLVLKIVPVAQWADYEAEALAYWAGCGAVMLLGVKREYGGLLMERVTPGTRLLSLCSADDRTATAAAASVIAELRAVRSSATATLPNLTSWIAALRPDGAQARPVGLHAASQRASSLASDLLAHSALTVLHGDLHHYNILKAERAPWLAVDPRGVIGPPEAEPAALLRNPRHFVLSHSEPRRLLSDRIAVLAERLGDNPRLLTLWGYVLAVVAAAWAFEDGERDTDVLRWLTCADILWQLACEKRAA